MKCPRKIRLTALFALFLLFAASPACTAAELASPAEAPPSAAFDPNRFVLDAERLTYEDATGIATAEGNVRARHLNMQMTAPYVQYDTKNEVIKAFSDNRNAVTMYVDNTKLTGQMAEFNTLTREGTLTQASGKMDAMYVRGDSIHVMPYEEAVEKKLISPRAHKPKAGSDDMVALSNNVTMTTCDFPSPHYRIVSDKMVVIPGGKTIVKHPKIYMGDTFLFTYPFDYIVQKNKQSGVAPYINYDSDLGAGIGIQGPIGWDSGQIDINAIYWTDDEFEARLGVTQSVGGGFSLFALTERLYNKDDKDILWRPQYGVKYENNGWTATLRQSERELIENEVRPGLDRRYNVWRKPEFQVSTPAMPFAFEGIEGKLTLQAIYGRYQDNIDVVMPWMNRIALNAYSSGTFMKNAFKGIRPFYFAGYRYYDYDDDIDSTQKITDAAVGFYWNIGQVELGTAYARRWVSGESPLYWDREYDREDIYQMLQFTVPGSSGWDSWTFGVHAGYDVVDKRIGEMVYKIAYNKHCMTFELTAVHKTPKMGDDEFEFGLRFILNAYPNDGYPIGEPEFTTPFEGWQTDYVPYWRQ